MKKITIAIPTYKRENLLRKLVDSISSNISLSISDNGGSLSESFIKTYKNATIVKQEHVLDIFANWNAAITSINFCDYIAIPSDDDLYSLDSFDVIQDAINNHDNIDIFIFGNNFINENDEVIRHYCPKKYEILEAPYGLSHFLYGVNVRMPSVFFKKSFLDKIGYFDEKSFTLTAADSELVQRALLLGKVAFVPKIVASYRVWSGSLTDQRIATKHWMNEIDIWTDKIVKLADSTIGTQQKLFNWQQYKDEVYAQNLLAGLGNLYKSKQYNKILSYYHEMRYPKHAQLKTKLRIFKVLLSSKIHSLNAS